MNFLELYRHRHEHHKITARNIELNLISSILISITITSKAEISDSLPDSDDKCRLIHDGMEKKRRKIKADHVSIRPVQNHGDAL